MNHILNVAEILTAQDADIKVLHIPEWGGSVNIRVFSMKQRREVISLSSLPDGTIDDEKLRVQCLLRGLCDDSGLPLFVEEQIGLLIDKSWKVLERIVKEIISRNSMDGKEESTIGEQTKN